MGRGVAQGVDFDQAREGELQQGSERGNLDLVALTLSVLGHATWHLYRRIVAPLPA